MSDRPFVRLTSCLTDPLFDLLSDLLSDLHLSNLRFVWTTEFCLTDFCLTYICLTVICLTIICLTELLSDWTFVQPFVQPFVRPFFWPTFCLTDFGWTTFVRPTSYLTDILSDRHLSYQIIFDSSKTFSGHGLWLIEVRQFQIVSKFSSVGMIRNPIYLWNVFWNWFLFAIWCLVLLQYNFKIHLVF
jgi:hypothetical protein